MKILIPGDKEKAKRKIVAPKQFKCDTCGCAFEATKGEYKLEDGLIGNGYLFSCKCPTCNSNVMRYE